MSNTQPPSTDNKSAQTKEQQQKQQIQTENENDQVSSYKSIYRQYVQQQQNQMRLYDIFKNNILIEDFTYSRRSALALIFLPAALNLFYIWKPYSPMKNTFRIGSILGSFLHFNYALKRDFKELSKKDTEIANKARLYAQNIAINNLSVRSFQQETQHVSGKFLVFKLSNPTFLVNKQQQYQLN